MNSINLEEFGKRIAELRESSSNSQEEICAKLGVTQQTLSRYEKGQRQASLDFVVKASKYFNVSADYLLGLTNVKSTENNIKKICEFTGLTEDSLNIILNIKSCPEYLTDKDRKKFINQTPIDTFNAIIEAINYIPNTLIMLNCIVNFKYSFKGEEEFEKKDMTIYEVFEQAFPDAEKFLHNKVAIFTNEEYAQYLINQLKNDFEKIVDSVIGTYNPIPTKLKLNTNFYNMKNGKRYDTLLSRFEEAKETYEFRINKSSENDEEDLKELEEYMKTPEYKERENNGELEWFEYPDEIAKIKYKELINRLVKISTEEDTDNAQHNPKEE